MSLSDSRRRDKLVKFRALDSEKKLIEERALSCGMKTGAYVRSLALGYSPRSLNDHKVTKDLLTVNADLGRLGGLLKLWLSQRESHLSVSQGISIKDIGDLYGDIVRTRELLDKKILELP